MMLNSTPSTNKVQNLLMLSQLKKEGMSDTRIQPDSQKSFLFWWKAFPHRERQGKASSVKYFCNRKLNERTNNHSTKFSFWLETK